MVSARGKKIDALYMILGSKDTIVITKAENQEELWNYKLDHTS